MIYLLTAVGLSPGGSSTLQYSTVQYSTVQYITAQYSTLSVLLNVGDDGQGPCEY